MTRFEVGKLYAQEYACGDALSLLDEMVARIEQSNAQAKPAFRGMKNAIGGEAYYWPRLIAIRDAIARGIV